jgi:hypothetical protein
VVAAGAPGLAFLAQGRVLVGGGRVRGVRKRGERCLQLGVGVGELVPERFDPARDVLHRGDLRGGVAARLLGRPDRLRGDVLLGLQRLHLRPQLARAGV